MVGVGVVEAMIGTVLAAIISCVESFPNVLAKALSIAVAIEPVHGHTESVTGSFTVARTADKRVGIAEIFLWETLYQTPKDRCSRTSSSCTVMRLLAEFRLIRVFAGSPCWRCSCPNARSGSVQSSPVQCKAQCPCLAAWFPRTLTRVH